MGKCVAYYTRPMSPAPAVVDAVQLAARQATIERDLPLAGLPRLREAGALEGTRAHAVLSFASFEGHPAIDARVDGVVVLPCQRCLGPVELSVDESAVLVVLASEQTAVPAGYDVVLADPEHLSVTDVIEEQVLLGLPLVAMHDEPARCAGPVSGYGADAGADGRDEEKQRPFSKLRELLDRNER